MSCLDSLCVYVFELRDELMEMAPEIYTLLNKIKELNYSQNMVISCLTLLHNLGLTSSDPAIRGALVQEVYHFAMEYTDSKKVLQKIFDLIL